MGGCVDFEGKKGRKKSMGPDQRIRYLPCALDDLSSNSETHIKWRETATRNCPLTFAGTLWHMRPFPQQ